MPRRRCAAFLLCFLLPVAAFASGAKTPPAPSSPEVPGETPRPAPSDAESADLSWTDLSGHRLSLGGMRGRVVVLNFWATWCAPCRTEIPELVRAQQNYGVLGVQVVGASADPTDQTEDVLKFARNRNVNFPIVLGATTDQMQALGLGPMLPGTVVLDREGRVVARFRGVFVRARLEAAIERALEPEEEAGSPAESGAHDHSPEHEEHGDHAHVAHAGTAEAEGSLVPS